MAALILAAFCLLLHGLLSLGWLLGAGGEIATTAWVETLIATVVGGSLFLGLVFRVRGAWWGAVLYAAVYALLGVVALSLGRLADFWQISGAPRQMLVFLGVSTGLPSLALCLLLLPGTRAVWHGGSYHHGGGIPALAPLVCAATLGVIALLTWQALERYPVLVHDEVRLFDAAQRTRIARYHGLLRTNHDIDYRVITGRNLGDLDRYAARRFRELDIGSVSDEGRGLLLVLDIAADEVRLEVGYALEPVFVDAFVAYIQERQMTEFFAAGQIGNGILATTEMIVRRADNADRNAGYAGEAWAKGSGGGGARTAARIGAGRDSLPSNEQAAVPAGDTPREVLDAYRRAMEQRNDNPNLAFYSAATKKMLQDWVVTPAQMDSVAQSLSDCRIESRKQRDNRTVLRSAYDARKCPPYFFVRENGRWRLDLQPMKSVLKFNHNNQWHLNLQGISTYGFAFADWIFDPNGYPTAKVTNERLLREAKSKTRPPLFIYEDGEFRTVVP